MAAKNRIQRLKNGIFVKNMGVKGLIYRSGSIYQYFQLPHPTLHVGNIKYFFP